MTRHAHAPHLPGKEAGRPTTPNLGHRGFYLGLWLVLACTAQGCAGSPPVVDYKPYQERAETQAQGDVSVTVAVPTAAEAKAIYGVDLAEQQIQPVWIEVRNAATAPYWFLPSGLDPEHFSPSEAAYAFHAARSSDANRVLDDRFDSLRFRNPVMPGATVAGFVLANLDEGHKAVDVDLVSAMDAKSFTFFTNDPSFRADYRRVDFAGLYGSDELIEIEDEDEFRRALARLPCCTTNDDGTQNGDPLNLVLIGQDRDIFPALIRRHWSATEVIWSGSFWRTVGSFLQGSRYRYSPISPLYAFGRPQDISAQKARGSVHERNHMRFWLSPIRFRGEKVWIGQISRDIGVKLTLKSPTISTHVIDPDVDEARRYLIEDLAYSQALYKIGFVTGVGEAGHAAPRTNLVGDPYYTDGLRAVLFFGPRPTSLADLAFLDWEVPARAASAAAKPPAFDDTALRARASTKMDDGIRVSAALPNAEESSVIFGIDLAARGMQAIWLEVENHASRQFWFLPTAIDPEYFSPLEVAFAYHHIFSGEDNAALDERLQALNFDSRRPIPPGSTISGFVFASYPRPTRVVDIDLVDRQWSRSFSLIATTSDAARVRDQLELAGGAYAATEPVRVDDEEQLRAVLKALPCCAAVGAVSGVPLNLILIGDLDAWAPAFVRRGYRQATVSPHYVFGRSPDFASEKRSRWVAAQPQVIRFWHTPIRYGDKPVWIAQVSAPLGGRFANAAADTKPPPIAPQVDDARNALVQDLLYSQAVTKLGFVDGVGRVMAAEPPAMSDGSSYHTDGLRAVMVFDRRPVALSQIRLFDWERP